MSISTWPPPSLPRSAAQPFVSILTPTYNRRAFFGAAIANVLSQTYPRERMEWVILDDGTDAIGDMLETSAALKASGITVLYIRSDTKLTIGAKRNRLHAAARGEILVTMDDDDYYSPERVNHAVHTLRARKAQIAGSSRIHLFFVDDNSIWTAGPYGPHHATFGTMAYTKSYAIAHPCNETVLHAEEIEFTREYREPLVQLDPSKVMLVICHANNTFDKSGLRAATNPLFKKTALKLRNFVGNAEQRRFYTELKNP